MIVLMEPVASESLDVDRSGSVAWNPRRPSLKPPVYLCNLQQSQLKPFSPNYSLASGLNASSSLFVSLSPQYCWVCFRQMARRRWRGWSETTPRCRATISCGKPTSPCWTSNGCCINPAHSRKWWAWVRVCASDLPPLRHCAADAGLRCSPQSLICSAVLFCCLSFCKLHHQLVLQSAL